ncbi:hypothetical protein VTN00DRAFT_3186 [Thermoascus crustaceus]|uniref:uncharacterized protein n=1 Tax=Thermoascus crustaceus TaxID=5088 RepID=UPI003743E74A
MAAAAPLAHAGSRNSRRQPEPYPGYAIVVNNCQDSIYLWSIGSTVGPQVRIDRGANYTERMHYDPGSGGVTLRITSGANGLCFAEPQMIFAYTLKGIQVYYSLADLYGDPFRGRRVALVTSGVHTPNPPCNDIVWERGVSPGPVSPRICFFGSNLTLTVC